MRNSSAGRPPRQQPGPESTRLPRVEYFSRRRTYMARITKQFQLQNQQSNLTPNTIILFIELYASSPGQARFLRQLSGASLANRRGRHVVPRKHKQTDNPAVSRLIQRGCPRIVQLGEKRHGASPGNLQTFSAPVCSIS